MISNATVFRAPQPRRAALGLLLAATILGSIGCATQGEPPPVSAAPPRYDAWNDPAMERVDTTGHGLLLVRPDHQLGRYDHVLIERIGFRYADAQRWLSFREEDRVSALLTAAVEGRQDGAIGVVDEPGPCVLAVRFYLTDLELFDPGYGVGSNTSFVSSFGKATFVMELRDSATDTPLARFMQRRELGGGTAISGTSASLRRLETVVGLAMRDMGAELMRVTPPTSTQWDDRCGGTMARVAFGQH